MDPAQLELIKVLAPYVPPTLIGLVGGLGGLGGGIGGVVLGQRMARRTAGQQIEAAEKRDQRVWDREDRARYSPEKLVLYGNFLAESDRLMLVILRMMKYRLDQQAAAVDSGEPVSGPGVNFPMDQELLDEVATRSDPLYYLSGEIEIICPDAVAELAKTLAASLVWTPHYIRFDSEQLADKRIERARKEREELKLLIRADLGVVHAADAPDVDAAQ